MWFINLIELILMVPILAVIGAVIVVLMGLGFIK